MPYVGAAMTPMCSSYGPIMGPQYIPLYNVAR